MLILVLAIPHCKMPSLTFRLPVPIFAYIDNSRFSIARFPPLLISSCLQILNLILPRRTLGFTVLDLVLPILNLVLLIAN